MAGHPKPTEFTPTNPDKYIGSIPIIMRSSWETHFAKILDTHPLVYHWASESIIIKYYNPIKQRTASYYTDFVAEFVNDDDTVVIEVFEVKPHREAQSALLLMEHQRALLEDINAVAPVGIASTARTAKSRAYADSMTAINAAKWLAAEDYCSKMGWNFKILTENQLFGKFR